jgi:hypothetical protein
MVRVFRNAAAAMFFVSILVAEPVATSTSCPPELAGSCQECSTDQWGYAYNGCEESCETNEDICKWWCDNEAAIDSCSGGPAPGLTCGRCNCNLAVPGVTAC